MIKRIYKLGNLEHNLTPTPEAVDRLRKVIESSEMTSEEMSLIWGPDLEVIELTNDANCENYIVESFTENEDGTLDFHYKKV